MLHQREPFAEPSAPQPWVLRHCDATLMPSTTALPLYPCLPCLLAHTRPTTLPMHALPPCLRTPCHLAHARSASMPAAFLPHKPAPAPPLIPAPALCHVMQACAAQFAHAGSSAVPFLPHPLLRQQRAVPAHGELPRALLHLQARAAKPARVLQAL